MKTIKRVFNHPGRFFASILTGALCLASSSTPLTAQESQIIDSFVVEDEYGSGGWLALKIKLPAENFAAVLGTTDLNTWTQVSEPILSLGEEIELHVPMALIVPGQFFRIATWPAPISFSQGDLLELKIEDEIPVSDALGLLGRKSGLDLFLTDLSEGQKRLKPGTYEADNIEDLLEKLGIRIWTPAFDEDDPDLAKLFPDDARPQTGELPDTEPGKGQIEDGWPGDDIQERPVEGLDDPPIDPKADMPFIVELPDLPPGTPQEPIPNYREPGTHLRLVVKLDKGGGAEPLQGYEVEGDALPQEPFAMPDIGATIWVVRSPVGAPNVPGQIYYIGIGPDPFEERSYDPPFRGSHGSREPESGIVNLRVPVPEGKDGPDMEGLILEVFRYMVPADIDLLTPEAFARNPNNFLKFAELDADDLNALIDKTGGGLQAQSHNSEMTQLFSSGSRSKKFNFVIIGDGFRDTVSDQTAFNNYVDNIVMNQLLQQDIHPEILNAMNIFRINTFSVNSGVTQVDTNGTVTVSRNTALMFRYSGAWNRCWMELGPTSEALLQGFINHHIPEADMIAVVLNEPGFGGCARSSHFAVTRGAGWGVFAHEFGHNPGGLGDEYQCNQGAAGCGTYAGAKPGAPNLDNTTSRSNIKWSQWIPSWRPLPTAQAHIADNQQDVGIFAGATMGSGQWWTGIYRPSWRGRMNDNNPVLNPVGYTQVRQNFRPWQEGNFRKSVVGDFNGDGLDDYVLLDDRQLSLHLADERNAGANDPVKGTPPRTVKGVLEPTWFNTGVLWNAAETWRWVIRPNDIIRVGDFDNDGRDDLYVANLVDWAKPYLCMLRSLGNRFEPVRIYETGLPGWTMKAGDEFYVADINDDGRSDLLVYNGKNWIMPYFLMVRSTGTGLQYVRRYDQFLPGWEMGRNEKFHVGDFDRDTRDDVAVLDTQSWNQVHLRVYTATSIGLSLRDRYYGTITTAGGGNFWQMRRKDRLHALDYDGDGTTDLAIFNGFDWGPVYLGMLRVNEGKIVPQKRYDNSQNNVPGWQMRRSDRFYVANPNGDARQDLVVFNGVNWSTEYLGILRSTGSGNLQGTWQDGWIGGWNLGAVDDLHVSDFRGTGGWDDLFIFNKNWLGLLRSHSNHYRLEAIYSKWIHNHRFHSAGLW